MLDPNLLFKGFVFSQVAIIFLAAFPTRKKLIKRDYTEICLKAGIKNKMDEYSRIHRIDFNKSGYILRASVPFGLGIDDFEKHEDVFKTNLRAENIKFKRQKGHCMVDIRVITETLSNLSYKPLECETNEVYVGYTQEEHLKVNLDTFTNILIGGCPGSGKSRLLLMLMTNIIQQNKNVELYLAQIRKSDLIVFEDCKQVKYFAKDLFKTRDMLKYLDEYECIRREKFIDKYTKQGVYNISDYNKRFPYTQLPHIIISLDEFSFYVPTSSDTPAMKKINHECLDHIKNIERAGRSSGLSIISSLQKPTKTSIPNDIKNLMATRISFKQMDSPSSVAILNNGNAINLPTREAICITNEEIHIKVPFIDYNTIMAHIGPHTEENHKYISIDFKDKPVQKEIKYIDMQKKKPDGVINLKDWGEYNVTGS